MERPPAQVAATVGRTGHEGGKIRRGRALFEAQSGSHTDQNGLGLLMTGGMDPEDDVAFVQMMPYFSEEVKSNSMVDTQFINHIPRLPADWMPHSFHFDGVENVGPCFARGVAKVNTF